MKQWTAAGLIMLALSYWVHALTPVAYFLLVISIGSFAWKLALLLRDRLFWKVRNRILASFVFVGVLPICIVTLIGLIIVWFLIGAMGTHRTIRQFEETIDRLNHIPIQIQLELYRTAFTQGLPLADAVNKTLQVNRDLQPLSIGIFERKGNRMSLIYSSSRGQAVKELPEWAADTHFAGIVIEHSAGYFRSVSSIEIRDRRLNILASIPLNQDYQRAVWKKSGILLSSPQLVQDQRGERRRTRTVHPLGDFLTETPDTSSAQDTSQIDLTWNMGILRLPWGGIFKAIDWERGPKDAPSRTLLLGLSIDPVRIIRDSLAGDFDMVNKLIIALITLCTVLIVVELISFSIGLLISRRITSAVHNLSQGTQAIRSGHLDFRIETRKHDQLGELANSFNTMAQSIQVLLEEVADKQRIDAELAMAHEVQAQFFPKRIPRIGRLELAGSCMPARMVSGDYYDFIAHGDTILDIVVSDISGKGMSAALMMAGLQSALRSQTMAGAIEVYLGRLARTVSHLNQYLCHNTAPDKFATLFISSYDPNSSTLSYCCAGHNPPYLFQDGKFTRLSTGGCPIGLFTDWHYEEAAVSIDTGDLFVIYTDGITEAQNLNEEEFGEQRLEGLITDNNSLSCEDMKSRILASVRDFAYGTEQYDDQTIVVGRIK